MDKLKLQTEYKEALDEVKIKESGKYRYSHTNDELTNFYTRKHYDEKNHVCIIWDNYGIRIEFNPTFYIYKHNLVMCTLDECKQAVEHLSNELGVNLMKWKITGYDFNVTVELNHPVKAYLPLFEELPCYNRETTEKDEGKHYQNKCKNRKFIVYDKLEESTTKPIAIPATHAGKHWGRFEHSVSQKMNQYTCFKEVETVQDFLTSQHWNNAADKFIKTFNDIKKHAPQMKKHNYGTPPHFSTTQKGKLYDILEAQDIDKYVIQLKVELGKQTITERRFKARVKDAREIWNQYINYNSNPSESILNELQDKINNQVKHLKVWESDNLLK